MSDSEKKNSEMIGVPTIVAVTIIVYFLCSFLHEAVGHGGAALLQGVKIVRITNAYCQTNGGSEMQGRIIGASGILVNLLAGLLAAFVFQKTRTHLNGVTKYCLWLFATANLFGASGYMASFSFLGFGDLHRVLRGLPLEFLLRALTFLAGVTLIIWTMRQAGRALGDFVPAGESRKKRALYLTVVPYIIGGMANVLASLLDSASAPLAIVLISSAGASLGGNFPMLFLCELLPKSNESTSTWYVADRAPGWLAGGIVFAILYGAFGFGFEF